MNNDYLLYVLFLSALTSSTILPGSSEAIFIYTLFHQPHLYFAALLSAISGNSMGAMISYIMGRLLPERMRLKVSDKTKIVLEKYGSPLLFFSWLPIVGDALPVAAGWLRISWPISFIYIIIGKTARYLILLLWVFYFQAA